jgi:hypothetical protein
MARAAAPSAALHTTLDVAYRRYIRCSCGHLHIPRAALGITTQKSLSFIDWNTVGHKHGMGFTKEILGPQKVIDLKSCPLEQDHVHYSST